MLPETLCWFDLESLNEAVFFLFSGFWSVSGIVSWIKEIMRRTLSAAPVMRLSLSKSLAGC